MTASPTPPAALAPYVAQRQGRSRFEAVRQHSYHLTHWGSLDAAPSPQRPLLVLLHGWMDIGASFQFMVDAMRDERPVVAPDWRGFGRTTGPEVDSYWFPDYLGDLDALLHKLSPDAPVDLLGHSMGGNVAMTYAGARPQRVRRLINLEGFGMPRTESAQAPRRMADWLNELREPARMISYDSAAAVAQRLRSNNPRLAADKAQWLAGHWSRQGEDGRWAILGDPAHKRPNPILYRVDEAMATWQCITAPLLWVEGAQTDLKKWWGNRYSSEEFHQRLACMKSPVQTQVLDDCGHMLHHDQPQRLAALVEDFLAD
jgi:pimeloyl-ACP methyl ester carboxylesterase